jgi:hypothetical protein
MQVIECHCGQQLILFGKTKCNDCGALYTEDGAFHTMRGQLFKQKAKTVPLSDVGFPSYLATQQGLWELILGYGLEG